MSVLKIQHFKQWSGLERIGLKLLNVQAKSARPSVKDSVENITYFQGKFFLLLQHSTLIMETVEKYHELIK